MRQYYKSFAITVRPRLGITDVTIDAFKSWLAKQNYSVAVLEMEAEARHLHAQIWLDEGRTKDDVGKAVKRICERTIGDWDAAQSKVLRGGIKIAYSDWYLEYLVDNDDKKDDYTEDGPKNVIINNPPDKTEQYYPSEEEQEAVRLCSNAADPRFLKMEQEANKYFENLQLDITIKNVAKWLCYVMFEERTMKVLVNQRDRTAICKTLYAYMTKSDNIELFLERSVEDKKLDKKLQDIQDMMETYEFSDA